MLFNHQKTFKKRFISNINDRPTLHKKGKQWIIVSALSLALAGGLGMVTTLAPRADTTANNQAKSSILQPQQIQKSADSMHSILLSHAPTSASQSTNTKSGLNSKASTSASSASSSIAPSSASAKSSASTNIQRKGFGAVENKGNDDNSGFIDPTNRDWDAKNNPDAHYNFEASDKMYDTHANDYLNNVNHLTHDQDGEAIRPQMEVTYAWNGHAQDKNISAPKINSNIIQELNDRQIGVLPLYNPGVSMRDNGNFPSDNELMQLQNYTDPQASLGYQPEKIVPYRLVGYLFTAPRGTEFTDLFTKYFYPQTDNGYALDTSNNGSYFSYPVNKTTVAGAHSLPNDLRFTWENSTNTDYSEHDGTYINLEYKAQPNVVTFVDKKTGKQVGQWTSSNTGSANDLNMNLYYFYVNITSPSTYGKSNIVIPKGYTLENSDMVKFHNTIYPPTGYVPGRFNFGHNYTIPVSLINPPKPAQINVHYVDANNGMKIASDKTVQGDDKSVATPASIKGFKYVATKNNGNDITLTYNFTGYKHPNKAKGDIDVFYNHDNHLVQYRDFGNYPVGTGFKLGAFKRAGFKIVQGANVTQFNNGLQTVILDSANPNKAPKKLPRVSKVIGNNTDYVNYVYDDKVIAQGYKSKSGKATKLDSDLLTYGSDFTGKKFDNLPSNYQISSDTFNKYNNYFTMIPNSNFGGTQLNIPVELKVQPKPQNVNVTVHYVDENGHTIASDNNYKGVAGNPFQFNFKTIPYYSIDYSKLGQDNLIKNAKYPNHNWVSTLVYKSIKKPVTPNKPANPNNKKPNKPVVPNKPNNHKQPNKPQVQKATDYVIYIYNGKQVGSNAFTSTGKKGTADKAFTSFADKFGSDFINNDQNELHINAGLPNGYELTPQTFSDYGSDFFNNSSYTRAYGSDQYRIPVIAIKPVTPNKPSNNKKPVTPNKPVKPQVKQGTDYVNYVNANNPKEIVAVGFNETRDANKYDNDIVNYVSDFADGRYDNLPSNYQISSDEIKKVNNYFTIFNGYYGDVHMDIPVEVKQVPKPTKPTVKSHITVYYLDTDAHNKVVKVAPTATGQPGQEFDMIAYEDAIPSGYNLYDLPNAVYYFDNKDHNVDILLSEVKPAPSSASSKASSKAKPASSGSARPSSASKATAEGTILVQYVDRANGQVVGDNLPETKSVGTSYDVYSDMNIPAGYIYDGVRNGINSFNNGDNIVTVLVDANSNKEVPLPSSASSNPSSSAKSADSKASSASSKASSASQSAPSSKASAKPSSASARPSSASKVPSSKASAKPSSASAKPSSASAKPSSASKAPSSSAKPSSKASAKPSSASVKPSSAKSKASSASAPASSKAPSVAPSSKASSAPSSVAPSSVAPATSSVAPLAPSSSAVPSYATPSSASSSAQPSVAPKKSASASVEPTSHKRAVPKKHTTSKKVPKVIGHEIIRQSHHVISELKRRIKASLNKLDELGINDKSHKRSTTRKSVSKTNSKRTPVTYRNTKNIPKQTNIKRTQKANAERKTNKHLPQTNDTNVLLASIIMASAAAIFASADLLKRKHD